MGLQPEQTLEFPSDAMVPQTDKSEYELHQPGRKDVSAHGTAVASKALGRQFGGAKSVRTPPVLYPATGHLLCNYIAQQEHLPTAFCSIKYSLTSYFEL